jgi:hypothetical protein
MVPSTWWRFASGISRPYFSVGTMAVLMPNNGGFDDKTRIIVNINFWISAVL